MDRRSFLGRSSPRGASPIEPVGVQLYTVRDRMQEDFAGTLQAVAQIGYTEVEFAGLFDHAPAIVRRMLNDTGLTAPAAHVEYNDVIDPSSSVFDDAAEVGNGYVVVAFLAPELRRSLDDYRRVADRFNDVGVRARAAGLRFAYHNHAFEFERIEGRRPIDVLLESTDPTLVSFELDLFWAVQGGGDPIELFKRHPQRFPMVHVKDRDADGTMVEVGKGQIDFARIFANADLAGIQHQFVEHDQPEDSMASIATSYRYLRALTAGSNHDG
jgi:sugar phosphate isomerase/epimerase